MGYVEFERILDHRNEAPVVREREEPTLEPEVTVSTAVDRIDVDDFAPRVYLENVTVPQPSRLVLWAEKSSAGDVLGPLAERAHADLTSAPARPRTR